MLKGLKKDGKKQTKKQTTEKKQVKNDTKKPKEEEEEDATTELVDINYDQKESAANKPNKKAQASKLEEKEIDTSTIVIEKKEEKKVITSWVVNEADIKNVVGNKIFNFEEHETDFVSLTDANINKELEEKAKKDILENKPKIEEKGGLRFAPLAGTEDKSKEPALVLGAKKPETFLQPNIAVKEIVFTNSGSTNVNFVPLEKTPQQLKEEELENKRRKEPELALKGKGGGWLGTKQEEVKVQQAEFKVSAWAAKANEVPTSGAKFAPLQRSAQEEKIERAGKRAEQEFVFVSKKDQEERRKAREQEAEKGKPEVPK